MFFVFLTLLDVGTVTLTGLGALVSVSYEYTVLTAPQSLVDFPAKKLVFGYLIQGFASARV